MKLTKRAVSAITALCLTLTGASIAPTSTMTKPVKAAGVDASMEWGTLRIGGGGFVSGIVTGKTSMYARTDVGGAYRYDYGKKQWVQLMDFVNDTDRGFLSVDAMCVDPVDDKIAYFLCGCAYFSSERTSIFKTTDGGETFEQIDVTDLIKVHGNGYGRQCGEAIAVDPDNPNILYCGGDTDGLIMSKDAGKTWTFVDSFDKLGLFTNEIKWPTWTDTIEKTTVGTDYANCNGIATVSIAGGKVFVGVSDNGIGANLYVADVGKDNWKPLSKDLPTKSFPSRINKDADGNLLICYVGGLTFNSTGGGIYKYDIKNDTVTNISPTENSFGGCVSAPDNADELIATTCGVWSSQLWYKGAWDDDKVSWGDQFYRSHDGGKTWESITPGNEKSWNGPLCADYLQDAGYDWIRNKAIHWCGAVVLDPRDSNRILLTSGNGVFACDNVWDELPVYYFHPDGIEEVVALDMVSVPGGAAYSAIGDYDGFIHEYVDRIPQQYQPNMGSTAAIAYCPSATNVMARVSENNSNGYYSTDGGKTWSDMTFSASSGKLAITETAKGKYRILHSSATGALSYTDDFGKSWKICSGIDGSKTTHALVDPKNPAVVYATGIKHNDYWASDPNKKEPTLEESHYSFYVSEDYGATFKETVICRYDQCDNAGDPAYLGDGSIAMAVGWYGMYIIKDGKASKLDSVFYAKCVGYGAPEKSGGLNTLFIYGRPKESDPEGIYRSQDGGKTWVCINTDHLYGGTGNGNFIVGDMNEFGKMYMSTVGCGIVYGRISNGTQPPQTTTTPKVTSTTPKTTTTTTAPVSKDTLYGDANCDKKIDISDVISVKCYMLNSTKYALSKQGLINADVQDVGNGLNANDAIAIQQYTLKLTDKLPVD